MEVGRSSSVVAVVEMAGVEGHCNPEMGAAGTATDNSNIVAAAVMAEVGERTAKVVEVEVGTVVVGVAVEVQERIGAAVEAAAGEAKSYTGDMGPVSEAEAEVVCSATTDWMVMEHHVDSSQQVRNPNSILREVEAAWEEVR